MSSLKATSNLRLALPWVLLICLGIAVSQLWQDRLALEKALTSSQQELAQISALSLEYQSVGGAIKADQQKFTESNQAIEWLSNSSKQQGINTKVGVAGGEQQGQKLGTDQINVSFKQAHFNRLIQWIQQQDATNLALVASQFTAADTGKVTGFVQFEIR